MPTTPALPKVISTTRLDLVALSPSQLRSFSMEPSLTNAVCGFETERDLLRGEERWIGALFAKRIEDDAAHVHWTLRAVVLRTSGTMVGHMGFHQAPREGIVEVGYTVGAPYRRQGFATEALAGLIEAGAATGQIGLVRACIDPANEASIEVVRSLGFTPVGFEQDEDNGLEQVFTLEV